VPSKLPIPSNSTRGSVALLRCLAAAACLLIHPHSHAQQAPATLSGTITDRDAALIPGAHLQLSQPGIPTSQQTLSASDGRFHFDHVPPGAFTLAITLQGFLPISTTGTLLPGQALELPPIALKIAAAIVHLDVVPDAPYTSEQELHIEESQRLIGLFPNFFVSYQWNAPPLTTRQKFRLAWKNVADPGNLFLVGTTAGVQQAANAFSGYGQGAAGYGRRYGADLGNLVDGTYLGGAILPSLFHQDPRYFYKGTGTKKARFFYAISRSVITRGDNGHDQPNVSGILGDLSAGAISNIYYPAENRNGARLTFTNGLLAIAGDAMNGLAQEFLLRHFTPKAKQTVDSGARP
jgi:hypothetical protein